MTDSSTVEDAPSVEDTTGELAASSTAPEVQAEGSLEDAVNAAFEKSEPEATPASDEQDSKGSETDSTEDDEISEDEINRTSERTQRRIRELVEQRKTAEGEVSKFREELDTLKPKADRMDQLTGYMQERNIQPEHLDNALGLTAMINGGDYEKALPILENLLAQVRGAAGEVLPNDLQDQVRLGYITEMHAKELHKARLGQQRAESKVQEDRQRGEAERLQRETQAVVNTAVSTAEKWNQEQAATDPDWNLKRDRIVDAMELELRRLGPDGYPRSDKAVRELLGKVKQKVETDIKSFQPKPKAIDPSPTGGSASPRSAAKPASLMDAVNIGLATNG